MSRSKTKVELATAADDQFAKLWKIIDEMPASEQNSEFNFAEIIATKKEAHWKRDKNLRDVLVHLYEWHQLLLTWVAANTNGNEKPFLPEPYTWKTYGKMNEEFWRVHQKTSLTDAKNMLQTSHRTVMKMIESFSDNELFTKKHFSWTGTTSLGSYCISATASHYDWAVKKLKMHDKTYEMTN